MKPSGGSADDRWPMIFGGLPGRARTRLRRAERRLRARLTRDRLRGAAAEMVDGSADRAVVIVADPARQDSIRDWLRCFSHDDVTVLAVAGMPDAGRGSKRQENGVTYDEVADLDGLLARLARLGAPDVIVIALGSAALIPLARNQGRLFTQLFLHLRPGGAYVVDRTVERVPTGDRRPERAQGRLYRILAAAQGGAGTGLNSREEEVARSAKRVLVAEDLVVATKRGRHLLKLREHQVGELLAAREPGVEVSVLETRPAGRLDFQVREASYGPSRADPWPERLEYPGMTLRHYEGDIASYGGMRLVAGDTLLPETFRWPHADPLRNPRVRSVTPMFTRPLRSPARVLDGDYYFLDCLFSGHFGHLTTEVLCRLWGWDRAKREIPGLKALFHTNPARERANGALERRLFTAYGIPESDLVWSDEPVRLRSVVGASPMWHNQEPYYVHPDIRETWARMTSGLLAGADPAEHERIFVSRGGAFSHRRGCRNQQEVERFFADRGYHVFYPEEIPLSEQVALFAGARVVAGFGGSAMFNLMHTQRLEAVVVFSHNAYTARNEHLFTSVLGSQLHYFWQPSDVQPPKVGRSKESDRSSFAVDFGTCGDDLARVLREL